MSGQMKRLIYWIREKYAFLKTILIFLILLWSLILRNTKIRLTKKHIERKGKKSITVAFFHPNCNACTLQENVLWSAVKALQVEYSHIQICIYTGNINVSPEDILRNVELKFDIKLQSNIRFVYLQQGKWIKSFGYLGSICVASEALSLLKPHIVIDTVGYGFVNHIFKNVGGCKVVNYIHNPMVTVDLLKTRHVILNDSQYVLTRRSPSTLGISKGIALLYGWSGRFSDIIMVNSSWTKEHINAIWKCSKKVHIVYPPIGLEKLMAKVDQNWMKKIDYRIMNASEFKSESNHKLILQALNRIKNRINPSIRNQIHLILINLSTENNDDYVKNLKNTVYELNLEDIVEIYPQNIDSNLLEEELIKASYGIYAKADDHFGTDIIAGLATGQIMIVHKSGAAQNEIICDDNDESRNGYLAKTVDEYSEALYEALKLSYFEKCKIQKAAKTTAEFFSCAHFQKEFLKLTTNLFLEKK